MDYVLWAAAVPLHRFPFDKLQSDFVKAFGYLHGKQLHRTSK